MTLVVTKSAAQQVAASAEQNGQQGVPLRVAAKRKPDGGIEYAVGFDETRQDDALINFHGIDVVVAPTSTELLSGAVMDFVELESGTHEFIFLNPNDPGFVPPDDQ